MKKIIFFLFIISGFFSNAQEEKSRGTIIVPKLFDFSKDENPYDISSYAKSFFEQQGFMAYIENEQIPVEIARDRCNAWYVNVEKTKGFMITKLVVSLKDCQGNIIAVSEEGKSNEKEYRLAYREAFRNAVKTLKITQKQTNAVVGNKPEAVAVKPIDNQQAVNLITAGKDVVVTENSNVYYAQPTSAGYQLVDSTPKVVLRMFRTSQPDYYIANSETANGVVFKKNNQWIYEYYQGDKLVSEVLQVKF